MRYDTSQNPLYLEYASNLTGTKDFGENKTIAFASDENKIMAVVVYNALDEKNCGISIASSSPKWCSKLVLKIAFGFPFIQLGLNRVTGTIRDSNHKARKNAERLGFTQEGELKEYYENGESAIIYGLTKSECIWI